MKYFPRATAFVLILLLTVATVGVADLSVPFTDIGLGLGLGGGIVVEASPMARDGYVLVPTAFGATGIDATARL